MDIIVFGLLIGIAISNGFFHYFEKKAGNIKNPLFLLANTFFIVLISLIIIMFITGGDFGDVLKALNWPIILVALCCIGFDVFIILSYKEGAKLSVFFDIITPLASIGIILIGVLIFNEHFTLLNIIGVVISLIGVYLIERECEE